MDNWGLCKEWGATNLGVCITKLDGNVTFHFVPEPHCLHPRDGADNGGLPVCYMANGTWQDNQRNTALKIRGGGKDGRQEFASHHGAVVPNMSQSKRAKLLGPGKRKEPPHNNNNAR